MAELPYMRINVANFLGDTAHLTTEELGAYFLLTLHCRQTKMPIRKSRLRQIARIEDPQAWAEIKDTISEFFKVEDGCWSLSGPEGVHHE